MSVDPDPRGRDVDLALAPARALLELARAARYAGPGGSERFRRLDDRRTRAVHEWYASRVGDITFAGGLATCGVSAALMLVAGATSRAAVALAALAALAAALATRRRARPRVIEGFAETGLPPLTEREHSRRRSRRQLRLGVIGMGAYVVAQVAAFAAEHYDQSPLSGIAAVGAVVTVVAFTAFMWSTVGTYGDEVKA